MADPLQQALIERARREQAKRKAEPRIDLGTALNKAGEAMTFGLIGDEADARVRSWLKGTSYEDELASLREKEEALERNTPRLALGAEIGGATLGALLPGGGISTLARGSGLGTRVLASGATGATGAGVYSFLEGEGDFESRLNDARQGAQSGAVIGAAIPVAGAGVQRFLDSRAVNRSIKQAASAAQQRAASGASYNAFEGAGAEITPDAFRRLSGGLMDALGEGADALPGAGNLTPRANALADTVRQMGQQLDDAAANGQNPMLPLTAIEQLRRHAGKVADDVNAVGRSTADGRLGVVAIDNIDEFVNGLRAADVGIGDGDAAVSALKKARRLWSQSIKTQMLENISENQDNYLGGQASAIRNGLGSLLRNPQKRKQFTEAEQVALRKIIGGNAASRAIRLMGNGIGRQMQMGAGGAMSGIPGLLAGLATGEVSAEIANRNAVRSLDRTTKAISAGALNQLPQSSQTARMLTEGILRRLAAGQVLPQ